MHKRRGMTHAAAMLVRCTHDTIIEKSGRVEEEKNEDWRFRSFPIVESSDKPKLDLISSFSVHECNKSRMLVERNPLKLAMLVRCTHETISEMSGLVEEEDWRVETMLLFNSPQCRDDVVVQFSPTYNYVVKLQEQLQHRIWVREHDVTKVSNETVHDIL
ncbi:hypothetical protein L1987_47161 [Smallanthus sonchifolius]|uniref:Uncharacterized protein n=1 Tax=Smallanthus sonchifolius TaxID=185202 RepID=A0ACB9G2R3_9ASTR|nr:hypothetical protein L1987_47161 [Smallanthus sonchifolius]